MKNKVFIFLLLFLILFSCKEKVEIIKKIKYINISFYYTEKTKINGKILLKKDDKKFLIFNNIKNDLTTDTTDTTEDLTKDTNYYKDSTSDIDLYIYKEQDIDFYEKRLKEIESIFINSFREKFKSYNIRINEDIVDDNENKDNNSIIVGCFILNYKEGEFNRIKNIPTELNIMFKISNKKLNIEKKYEKKLVAKSLPELPTERIRIKDIADRHAIFFLDEFSKIKIEENINNKETKKEKK